MTRGLFLASPEARTGKSAVAVGLLDILAREVGTVGIFRPLVDSHHHDELIDVLLARPGVEQTYEEARGVTYEAAHAAGATGPVLNRLFQKAFAAAKHIRTNTAIARGSSPASMPR